VIEKDNIKELFSRSLENHAVPVRPEVWNGLQAKMAAAGVSSAGAGAAAKGLSALTKWLIGSAAVTGTAVITTVAILNSSEETPKHQPTTPARSERTSETTSETPVPQQEQQTTATISNVLPLRENQQRTSPVAEQPILLDGPDFNWWEDIRGTVVQDPVLIQTPVNSVDGDEQAQQDLPNVIVQKETSSEQVPERAAEQTHEKAKIEFPNVFTPNGDGENEFYHFNVCENVKSVAVTIRSSANNEIVFTSDDKNFQWNGIVQRTGEPAPKGLYACSVTYEDLGGKAKKVHFIFELIR
jgi:gliding motility-associated-like protein